MAEGLLRALTKGRFEVHSAGTVATALRPEAVRVMGEIGIDITSQKSKAINRYLSQRFDWVITVCDDAREACPVLPGSGASLHWSLPDPSAATGEEEDRLRAFREVRDRLRQFIEDFLRQNDARSQKPKEGLGGNAIDLNRRDVSHDCDHESRHHL